MSERSRQQPRPAERGGERGAEQRRCYALRRCAARGGGLPGSGAPRPAGAGARACRRPGPGDGGALAEPAPAIFIFGSFFFRLYTLSISFCGLRARIREDRDGGGRMSSFMPCFPGLGHQPDIVLKGFDGPALAATRSWRSRRVSLPETPSSNLHRAAETRPHRGARRTASLSRPTRQASQYTMPAHLPGAPRLRLLT